MKAVLEAGLDVPNDVALVGCGNVTYADLLRVPLTSVDQHSAAIGERAAKLALSLLEQRPVRPRQILLSRNWWNAHRHNNQGSQTRLRPSGA